MIKIPVPSYPEYDNNSAHQKIKQLMTQQKQLSISLDNHSNFWISTEKLTRLKYRITPEGWNWILNYLRTGDYEDFGVNPNDEICDSETISKLVRSLIEGKDNFNMVPFLRETQRTIKLVGLFSYGKLIIDIVRDDDTLIYLKTHKRYEDEEAVD